MHALHATLARRLVVAVILTSCAAAAAQRPPAAGRTLVFSRSQLKYSFDRNYMRRWLDRPLLIDPATRVAKPRYFMTYPSYERMMRVVMSYGLDGFAFFPETSGRIGAYEFSDRAHVPGFRLLTEFVGSDRMPTSKGKALAAALQCKCSARIGGKLLITSYSADAFPPEKWKTTLAKLRAKHGDTFLFLPALARVPWREMRDQLEQTGRFDPKTVEKWKAHLRAYLDVCDGVYLASMQVFSNYDRQFDAELCRKGVVPIYQSVLAEPAYQGKLFGLSAGIAHFNTEGAQANYSGGTKRLRQSFEIAMSAHPDVIVLPEWDEENENTCIRPTVFNSFSTQRILSYYMHQLKREPPAPNPGDDLSLPNLIVSYRKMLVLGEALEVELLQVPDAPDAKPYTVALAIKDPAGRVLKQFPPHRFAGNKIEDKTFALATEPLADCPVLIPSLTITTADGRSLAFERGLHYIQLRATWNWDYKWVKQPLRDLIAPSKATFEFAAPPKRDDDELVVVGEFACDEDIASVEVLEDDAVVYAVDPDNAFFRDDADAMLVWIEFMSMRTKILRGTIAVRGAKCRWPEELRKPGRHHKLDGDALKVSYRVGGYFRRVVFAVPKADVPHATIEFDFGDLLKTTVPLARIAANDIYSETHDDGLTLTVCRYSKQPDHPRHLDRKSVSFRARVRPELPTSVLHMRVVTKSGKTFRSRPLTLPWAASGERVKVNVISDATKRATTLEVDRARVPQIDYDFTPKYGSIFHASAGRPFWGQLGGFACTSAGRGGNTGGSSSPFRGGRRAYPKDANATAPTWTTEDGAACLKFDGVGNFIAMPNETVPRWAGFTVTFEIKPLSRKTQVLFTHYGYYIGSLMVKLVDGKLVGSFTSQLFHAPGLKTYPLNSGLTVPIGEWSKIEIVCDQATAQFRVNGKSSPRMTCPGPGLYLGRALFGGYGINDPRLGWFEGCLRSLSIRHGGF